jgi:hypothetical protein
MSQAPPPGEGSGGVDRAAAAAALRPDEEDLDAIDERRSLHDSDGRETRDFSL